MRKVLDWNFNDHHSKYWKNERNKSKKCVAICAPT
jgi:hypothetical protein